MAANVGQFSPVKDFAPSAVGQLLATFFVLALFVERTLEVFITAWRGEETVKRESEVAAVQAALVPDPANPALEAMKAEMKAKSDWLIEYKCETQAIALRCGLVLGILVAAVAVRAFPTFVELPASANPTVWVARQSVTLKVLDTLISGGIIGGGSEAIHKMMNVITGFFDATAVKIKP